MKYIISNYWSIPEAVFFIHDEDRSWHHRGLLTERFSTLVESFRLSGTGFYEINEPPLDFVSDIQSLVKSGFWEECLEQELGLPPHTLKPRERERKCCSQFIVSKRNILQHPKQFYEKLYDWTIQNTNETAVDVDGCEGHPATSACTGRLLEWAWSFIFEWNSE